MTAWDILLIVVWTLWIVQAFLCVLQTRKLWRRLTKEQWGVPIHNNTTLIVPFKGIDPDLPNAIASLCRQDFPNYHLLLVVESTDDPAYDLIKQELAKQPPQANRSAEILVAGLADAHQTQKLHNQLAAIAKLEPTASDDDIWAFADSDAVPGPHWLRQMTGPLGETRRNGMTTGYRWFIPMADPDRPDSPPTIWSHLASVMNSSVASVYRQTITSLAWGGAMAIRVETARRGRMKEQLTGALTDDLAIGRMVQKLSMKVWYVPQCIVASPAHFDRRSLVTFARRQYLIFRIHEPLRYVLTLMLMGFWVLAMLGTWIKLAVELLHDPISWRVFACLLTILTVAILNQCRAFHRRKTATLLFDSPTIARLKTAWFIDRWLTPLWMTVHWLLMWTAAVGRHIRWRGVVYRADGPHQVTRLGTAQPADPNALQHPH